MIMGSENAPLSEDAVVSAETGERAEFVKFAMSLFRLDFQRPGGKPMRDFYASKFNLAKSATDEEIIDAAIARYGVGEEGMYRMDAAYNIYYNLFNDFTPRNDLLNKYDLADTATDEVIAEAEISHDMNKSRSKLGLSANATYQQIVEATKEKRRKYLEDQRNTPEETDQVKSRRFFTKIFHIIWGEYPERREEVAEQLGLTLNTPLKELAETFYASMMRSQGKEPYPN